MDEKFFDWCDQYGLEKVKINLVSWGPSVTIFDSNKIKKTKHMKDVINWLKNNEKTAHVMTLPTYILIAEWKAHNLLYKFNYDTVRTEHLDIENNMPLKYKIGYILLSLFYF
jgi:DNA modification methylase